MKRFAAPIGIDDFRDLRESGAVYVDKTGFISELLSTPTKVSLFPRPRRFGKTLNLSTLRYFLERSDEDRAPLFEGLDIWGDENARKHFGRYPVIELSLRQIKARSYDGVVEAIRGLLGRYVQSRAELLDSPKVGPYDRRQIDRLLAGEAGEVECWNALETLSRALATHWGERVVILIDEYDTPIQQGYRHGFYDDVVLFFRNFLGGALKSNPHLQKGAVTGILRVARESLFSDLNNLAVYSTLEQAYATAFGFTEDEVERLAEQAGAAEHLDLLREWYDGYRFGGHVIYNPWSVLNFLADPGHRPKTHWVNTGGDAILRDLILDRGLGSLADQEALLRGEEIDKPVTDPIALRDLEHRADAVWSFLLAAGYLTATEVVYGGPEVRARLRIPNREVRSVYETLFLNWLRGPLASDGLEVLLRALLGGDAATVEQYLTRLLTDHASYHDFPRPAAEAPYHAFVLGLLVRLAGDYDVRSNRESGLGRADVLIAPHRPGRPGVVLELKVPGPDEDVDAALEAAARQITERRYAADLRGRGADPVHALAVVFAGKRAYVRRVPAADDGGE